MSADDLRFFKVYDLLNEIGCCLKCSLRLSGINFTEWEIELKTSSETNSQVIESIPDEKPCIICLGVLQNKVLKSFVDKIKDCKEISQYDSDTVFIVLNIPSAIQIRERAVNIYLSKKLDSDKDFIEQKTCTVKEVWQILSKPLIENILKKDVGYTCLSSPLTMEIHVRYEENQNECTELYENFMKESDSKKTNHKKDVSKKTIDIILNSAGNEKLEKCIKIPPEIPLSFASVDKFICKHNSIYIAGRYTKLSRRLSQTPWMIQGKSKVETSVEEIINGLMIEFTKAECAKFLSSGREDVDVRMLFNGRPFAVELVNPKITKLLPEDLINLRKMTNLRNEKVQISNELKIVSKEDLKVLKEGESSKTKSYRCLCICKQKNIDPSVIEKLQSIKDLKIIQKTPVRVLHRRCFSLRERVIHDCRARLPSDEELTKYRQNIPSAIEDCCFIIIDLKTQAGTYVKEFVHGDFGRTSPNLGSLLNLDIDIVALDVIEVGLEWP